MAVDVGLVALLFTMQITLRHVSKGFGSITALDDVSLDIAAGEIIAVVGANGAGKTTLLRCLAGLVVPKGEIRFDGELFRRDRLDLRRRFFFLPDEPYVLPGRTVLNHIGMVLRIYDADHAGVEERVVGMLHAFDMLPLADAPLSSLSRGQFYKTGLIAVLAVDPELWMVDEPFASGMDPRGLAAFREYANEATERGRTVLYTTQILELAERFSDRVCILRKGRVHSFDTYRMLESRAGEDSALEQVFRELHEEPSG